LLINELKAQAQQETTAQAKPEGIAGFIEKIKDLTALLQARIELLRSGGSAAPQVDKGIYFLLGEGERGTKTIPELILSVAAVLAGALLIEWVFVSLHRGGTAPHHLQRASRMDRQNRGPLFAGPAGF
jgi:hypothetical protein